MEILNAGGAVIRRYSSSDPAPASTSNTLAVNAVWQRAPEPLSAAAGMHRFVWDFRPDAAGRRPRPRRARRRRWRRGRGGPPPVATGAYSVKLTANGKTLTQPLTLKPDPREK